MAGVNRRFRDALASIVPWWASDRTRTGPGANIGYRFLWVLVGALDGAAELLTEGIKAWMPGKGTPTALRLIGRSRGMVRGRADTDDAYAERLRTWLDRWPEAGSQRGLVRAVWDFLGGGMRIRIVNRGGRWTTIESDGQISETSAAWDWDSISNPERAAFWSELWIIVYPPSYDPRPGTWGDGELWGDTDGMGTDLLAPLPELDQLRAILAAWKAAHSYIRAVIFCADSALFDPLTPASLPNGRWGQWSIGGAPSDRNTVDCRYLEFAQ